MSHQVVFRGLAGNATLTISSDNRETLAKSVEAILKAWDLELAAGGVIDIHQRWERWSVKSWRVGTLRQWELSNTGWMTFIRDIDYQEERKL